MNISGRRQGVHRHFAEMTIKKSSTHIKTRFAPSPTGYLHLGGARTALYNWLYARGKGGEFILRIEDTDVERSTKEGVDVILAGLSWLGITWDEAPFFQSRRRELYKAHLDILLKKGMAYPCYCSPEELEERRNRMLRKGGTPMYDGRCRDRSDAGGGPHAFRFCSPREGKILVKDLIRGEIGFDNAEIDDFVIVRRDGRPVYNFSVVVDDITMGISHVIRGDEHLKNTSKQILLYNALSKDPPLFAHLPLIQGPDRSPLSKRHGATSVLAYREMGYLPEAVVNYLVRIGWSSGDQEVFSIDELIERFDLKDVGRSAGIFDPDKLKWLNGIYIRRLGNRELAGLLIPFLERAGYIQGQNDIDMEWLSQVAGSLKERAKTLVDMAETADFYFQEPLSYDKKAESKFLTKDIVRPLEEVIRLLMSMKGIGREEVEREFRSLADKEGVKLKDLAQAARVALTGRSYSPPISDVITLLGSEETVKRLKRAIEYIRSRPG